jgi:diaminopimelate epimerase
MEVEVQIMSGAGNIFSVIDNRKYQFDDEYLQKLAPLICSKSFSKGKTEGLLVVNNPKDSNSDFLVNFFNPDGTTGMMCGNGGRCAVSFALDKGLLSNKRQNIVLEFSNNYYSATLIENRISLEFPPPIQIQSNISISVDGISIVGGYVDVGSPHFVINILNNELTKRSHIKNLDVLSLGKKIRYHPYFEPNGTNIDFYIVMNNKIYLRTYERGVENETGACGTGAISTALISYLNNEIELPVEIITSSEHTLTVDMKGKTPDPFRPILIGETEFLEKNIVNI